MAPFCSCPASLVSRKIFAVGPGCAKCSFFVALRWAPRPFGGASAKKKNTTQGVFFFCSGRGKAGEAEAPCRHGARAEKKKHHPGCFFFCSGPRGKAGEGRSPVPARGFSFPCLSPGPEQKKNTRGGDFFLLRPSADAHSLTAGLGGDASPSPGWCFFLLRPRPDRAGVFFFVGCGPARTLTHSLWAGAISAKARVVFFFAAAPPGLFRQ